jgi:DNA-binding transcriptional ArsR family regulator
MQVIEPKVRQLVVSTSTVAEIGSLLGDPARVNMMIALLDGRAWTARELAEIGGVTPQTASSHLGKLAAANMVCVDRQGRHRYHRIASAEVAALLEQMHVAGAALDGTRARARIPGSRDAALRELRSCYDHLAGRVAVEVSDKLLEKESSSAAWGLSNQGKSRLEELGIDLASLEAGRRTFCRPCLDWSERRPHVAGSVGSALLARVRDLGWIRSRPQDRALTLTEAGERGMAKVFAIHAVRSI